MAKNIQMKKREGNQWDNLFPLTLTQNVFNQAGETIDTVLKNQQEEIDNTVDDVTDKIDLKGWELNSKKRKPETVISFISDDGHISDYTIAKPIFDEVGVPLNLSISTEWTNTSNRLSTAQMLEVQNNGWEIMSGLVTHAPITDLPLYERDRQLKESQEWFEERGLRCDNLAYPHGDFDYDTQVLAKKYYRSSRLITKDLNTFPIESQGLKTYWMSTLQTGQTDDYGNFINTYEYYKRAIDDAVAEGGYLIISFHSADIFTGGTDMTNLMYNVLNYAKSRAPVLTVNDALDRIGNIIDVGIYRKHTNFDHFVVGVNGKIEHSTRFLDENEYSTATTPRDFKEGVSTVRVTSASPDINTTPIGQGGTLVTFKPVSYQTGNAYVRQEFINLNSFNTFYRYALTSTEWSEWTKGEGARVDNGVPGNKHLKDYPLGITTSIISSENPGINTMPEGEQGTLNTYIVNKTGSWGYSYQEFKPQYANNMYLREGTDPNGDWSEWREITLDVGNLNTGMNVDPEKTLVNGVSAYEYGITMTIMTSAKDLTPSPLGEAGTLITYIFNPNGQWAYNYQVYTSNNSKKKHQRHGATGQSWGDWYELN